MFEFEDEVESSIDYVAREVRQEYLKSFEQDLKEATEQIQNLKQQLEAIISDDLRARHIESLKAESAQLEALVKSMVDKDRRVLKRIDIAKTHLNTENRKNKWFVKQVKEEEDKLEKQIAWLREARTIRLPNMDEENLSSVARAKPWRVITTKEEILARAITKQNEKERRDAVKAKIICVAQRDAVRDFLTQCTDLCNKREWTKLKTTSNPKRSKQAVLDDCMLLLQNKKGVDDDERTEEGLDLQFVTDDVNRIESLASELAFIPEIYTIISNNLD